MAPPDTPAACPIAEPQYAIVDSMGPHCFHQRRSDAGSCLCAQERTRTTRSASWCSRRMGRVGAAPARHAVPTGVAVEVDRGLYRARRGPLVGLIWLRGCSPSPRCLTSPAFPPRRVRPGPAHAG